MLSINAQYEYFNEFKDFRVGFYDDLVQHYNYIEEEQSNNYFNKISELSQKLKLEVEINLICFSDSKTKTKKYLDKILFELLVLRDKLDWYEDETKMMEVIGETGADYGFQNKLWWLHWDKLNELVDFCRAELLKAEPSSITNKGRKPNQLERIPLKTINSNQLSGVFFALIAATKDSKPFITGITYREFESHFTTVSNSSNESINWVSEKYLLTYFFDILFKLKLIDKEFKSNCDIILSNHFVFRGNKITPTQLSSARDFLKKKTKVTLKSSKMLKNLQRIQQITSKLAPRQNKSEEDELIVLSKNSALQRI